MELKFDRPYLQAGESGLLIVPCGIEIRRQQPGAAAEAAPFNRTMWNWNFLIPASNFFRSQLLIVPCGIEISLSRYMIFSPLLLIVPCGIEMLYRDGLLRRTAPFNRTMWNWNIVHPWTTWKDCRFLIVPCGIEIRNLFHNPLNALYLLIVPCGIEIYQVPGNLLWNAHF